MRSSVIVAVLVVVALAALLTQGQELKYQEREVSEAEDGVVKSAVPLLPCCGRENESVCTIILTVVMCSFNAIKEYTWTQMQVF